MRGPADVPRVSVVVPTRDRPDRLATCLAALERETVPELEIVVVDDASRDVAAVAAAVADAPRARLVRGTGRGPAAARNAGVAAARAPVVCFTDDDCEPVPGWAAALAACLGPGPDSTGADAAAGPTRNGRPRSVVAAAAQAVATHLAEATIDAAGRMRFAPTSNLACRAEVCAAVPFDESYPLAAGEDRDWCARLVGSGRTLAFVPGRSSATTRSSRRPGSGASRSATGAGPTGSGPATAPSAGRNRCASTSACSAGGSPTASAPASWSA